MAAADLIARVASANFNTNTTPKTAGVLAVQVDDLIVVKLSCEQAGNGTYTPTTAAGSTAVVNAYAQRVTAGTTTAHALSRQYTAVVTTAGNLTVSMAASGVSGTIFFGFEVEQWRNSGGPGVTATAVVTVNGAPSATASGVSDDSAMSVCCCDWNGGATTGKAYRTADAGAFSESAFAQTANYTYYLGYHADCGAPGTKVIGMTAPNQRYALTGLEIFGLNATPLPLAAASASAAGSLVLGAPTRPPLAVASAVAGGSLALSAPHAELPAATTGAAFLGVGQGYQRKAFVAAGLWWLVFGDGAGSVEDLYYVTSDDEGETWSSPTLLRSLSDYPGGSSTAYSDFHFDGEFLHYVIGGGGSGVDLVYRRGTPQSNATLSWSAGEQVAHSGNDLLEVAVSTDSDGVPWVSWEEYNGESSGFPLAFVSKAAAANGTWATAGGFPHQLSTSESHWYSGIARLNDAGGMIAVYWNDGVFRESEPNNVYVKVWDGDSWGSEMGIDVPQRMEVALPVTDVAYVADVAEGVAHVVWVDAADARMYCWSGDGGGGTVAEVSDDSIDDLVSVGLDGAGQVNVFAVRTDLGDVPLRRFVRSTSGVWGEPETVVTVAGGVPIASMQVSERGAVLLLAWQEFSAGDDPIFVRALVTEGPAVVPIAPTAVVAAGTLALQAPTALPLAGAAATAAGSLILVAAASIAPGVAAATAAGSLALRAPTSVPLLAGSATASGALALRTSTAMPFEGATASATGSLALRAPTAVPLAAAPVVAAATLTLSIPGSGGYDDLVVADGARHYWKMGGSSGDVPDEIGSSDLAVVNVTRGVSDPHGGTDAISFNGSNSFASALVNLSDTGEATLEVWALWDAYAADDDLLCEFTPNFNANPGSWIVNPNNSTGGVEAAKISVGQRGTAGTYRVTAFQAAMVAGAWHHIVYRFDLENGITILVDGQAVAITEPSTVVNPAENFANSTLYLMSRAGAALFGAGDLSRVAVYPLLLTDEQVEAHYNAGVGGGSEEVEVPLAAATAVSTASLALTAPTTVPLQAAPVAASASLALRAPTAVPLAASAAAVAGALALVVPGVAFLPLVPADAVGAGALALRAQTAIPLAAAAVGAAGALALRAPTTIPLAAAAGTAAGLLALRAPALFTIETVALGPPFLGLLEDVPALSAAAVASGALTITVPGGAAIIPLAAAAATAAGALALRAPTAIPIAATSAIASGTLALRAPAIVPLAASAAAATASLSLRAVALLPFTAAAGVAGTSLTLAAATAVPLAAAVGAASGALTVTIGSAAAELDLAPAPAALAGTLAVRAATSVGLVSSAAIANGAAAFTAQTQILLVPASGMSVGTLSLNSGSQISLTASAALASGALHITAATGLPLATSAALATSVLNLAVTPSLPLAVAAAQGSGALSIIPGAALALTAATATAAGVLNPTAATGLLFATAGPSLNGTLLLLVPGGLALHSSAAAAAAALVLSLPARLPLQPAAAAANTPAITLLFVFIPRPPVMMGSAGRRFARPL